MMGHADSIHIKVFTKLFKMVVAQFACGHLNAQLVQGGVLGGVEVHGMKSYAMFSAQVFAKSLVAKRLFTT